MKTNKELINALEAYFITQDPKSVARSLAAMMIDIHRLINMDDLGKNEKRNLIARSMINSDNLTKFSIYGPQGDLQYINVESEDDE